MKPTQEQVIAWAQEAEAYETDDPANANERIWVMNDEELQAATALAYEAGRKDENEACAAIAAWILKMPENDVSAAIRARGEQ